MLGLEDVGTFLLAAILLIGGLGGGLFVWASLPSSRNKEFPVGACVLYIILWYIYIIYLGATG